MNHQTTRERSWLLTVVVAPVGTSDVEAAACRSGVRADLVRRFGAGRTRTQRRGAGLRWPPGCTGSHAKELPMKKLASKKLVLRSLTIRHLTAVAGGLVLAVFPRETAQPSVCPVSCLTGEPDGCATGDNCIVPIKK
jgi:hypothetical protein